MTTEEMVCILEDLIRDPETNATAKCTGIRVLREIQQQVGLQEVVDDDLERALYGDEG
jgi:hypothetical protein